MMKKIVKTCVFAGSVLMTFFLELDGAEIMDAQSRVLLNEINSLNLPPVETLPVDQLVKETEKNVSVSSVEMKKIEEIKIIGSLGEIPIRIYIPLGQGPFPVFITFHGGGWAFGNLDLHDPFCRTIADKAKVVVVSVGYRLAPKYKFPKPLLDCYSATEWVAKNIAKFRGDPNRLVVSGQNSGGNLAAAVALMAKDKGGPSIAYQVLIYPVTNYGFDTPSYKQFADGFCLTKNAMKWFWSLYLNNSKEGKNPYASPLQAPDLSNLPPAMFVLADFDPLYDDGVQYAQKLQKNRVPVTINTYPTFHGFINMDDHLTIGQEALDDIANQLKSAFAGK